MSSIAIAGGSSGRTILTANKSYFVSATGSDSNGGTNSTTDAWATLQHAMNFISVNIDIAGFIVTVNIGAGSFSGIGIKGTVGGGILIFTGAGSASTTVTNGPNDGVFNLGECVCLLIPATGTEIAFNKVKMLPTANKCVGIVSNGLFFELGDPTGGSTDIILDCTNGPTRLIDVEGLSTVSDAGPVPAGAVTVIGANQTIGFCILTLSGGQFFQNVNWTFSGNLTVSNGLANATDGGAVIVFGGTMVGAGVIATRFLVSLNGYIDAIDPAGTHFPGNAAGVITSGGQYSGITDYNGNVAGLPTPIQGAKAYVTDALGPTFGAVVAGGGGVYSPIYGDGAAWRCG